LTVNHAVLQRMVPAFRRRFSGRDGTPLPDTRCNRRRRDTRRRTQGAPSHPVARLCAVRISIYRVSLGRGWNPFPTRNVCDRGFLILNHPCHKLPPVFGRGWNPSPTRNVCDRGFLIMTSFRAIPNESPCDATADDIKISMLVAGRRAGLPGLIRKSADSFRRRAFAFHCCSLLMR